MVVSWQSEDENLQGDLLWYAESEVFFVVVGGTSSAVDVKAGVRDDYAVFRFCGFFGLRDPVRGLFLFFYSEYSAGIEEVVVFVLREKESLAGAGCQFRWNHLFNDFIPDCLEFFVEGRVDFRLVFIVPFHVINLPLSVRVQRSGVWGRISSSSMSICY